MGTPPPISHDCPYCGSGLAITAMSCHHCQVKIEAPFPMSHLGSLPVEHQRFIEMFVLCGGNLKALAEQVDVSYPTIRSRFDKVIDALRQQITAANAAGANPLENPDEKIKDVIRKISL